MMFVFQVTNFALSVQREPSSSKKKDANKVAKLVLKAQTCISKMLLKEKLKDLKKK